MSEDVLSADVDEATKMITDTAADGVEFIFGTAFKEDMQDEMTITVIAAGFDDMDSANDAAVAAAAAGEESHDDDIIPIDNPLIDGLGFGAPSAPSAPAKPAASNQDYDLDDIFKMLGN